MSMNRERRGALPAFLLLGALALAGCTPDLDAVNPPCDPSGLCPVGMVCGKDNRCEPAPDQAVDMGGPDGPAADLTPDQAVDMGGPDRAVDKAIEGPPDMPPPDQSPPLEQMVPDGKVDGGSVVPVLLSGGITSGGSISGGSGSSYQLLEGSFELGETLCNSQQKMCVTGGITP